MSLTSTVEKKSHSTMRSYVSNLGPNELYEDIKDTMAQDNVHLSPKALDKILTLLQKCITTSSTSTEALMSIREQYNFLGPRKREAALKRQAQSQRTYTDSHAETDGYGPPIAFDRAFYFHHKNPNFIKIIPAADLLQYELRPAKKPIALKRAREVARDIVSVGTTHRNHGHSFMEATSKYPLPSSPTGPTKMFYHNHPTSKNSQDIRNSLDDDKNQHTSNHLHIPKAYDDNIPANTPDNHDPSPDIPTQPLSHPLQQNFLFPHSTLAVLTQDMDGTHGCRFDGDASHHTQTQRYLEFIRPIFSRPMESSPMATCQRASRACRATCLPNASSIPSFSAVGKRTYDSVAVAAESGCKRVKLSR